MKRFASYPRVVSKAAIASIIRVMPGHGKIDACRPARSRTGVTHGAARAVYAVARQSVNPVVPPIADELGTVTADVG